MINPIDPRKLKEAKEFSSTCRKVDGSRDYLAGDEAKRNLNKCQENAYLREQGKRFDEANRQAKRLTYVLLAPFILFVLWVMISSAAHSKSLEACNSYAEAYKQGGMKNPKVSEIRGRIGFLFCKGEEKDDCIDEYLLNLCGTGPVSHKKPPTIKPLLGFRFYPLVDKNGEE